MKNIHIHIEGQVQGVGFRPYVFRLANEFNLTGWVCNSVDGVHIEVHGKTRQLDEFANHVLTDAPSTAHITGINILETRFKKFPDFRITESLVNGNPSLLITPDIALCEHCRSEIRNYESRRYHYPFTTCTHCGPRYSILKSIPYDRPATSMASFTMCENCLEEYQTPSDRRYYSQTNSCHECAIDVWMLNAYGEQVAQGWHYSFPMLIQALKEGKIVALKGTGGYLLLVDACREEAIKILRARKHRPGKPFALMYPDVETLAGDVVLSKEEIHAFKSEQSPIVLLKLKPHPASGICTSLIAPGLNSIGAMQPHTAMFDLVMQVLKKPLIATSGNVSGSPILHKDDTAFHSLNTIADLFLVHNREIEIAQDDSVVRYTPHQRQRIILRRSRGFAPANSIGAFSNEVILAMGADMKSTFSLQANGRIYTSQYLGDLESYESQENYRSVLRHLIHLVDATPEQIIIDAHPDYFSSWLGKKLAADFDISTHEVQHHKAHAFSVLAENDLLNSQTPVLCVVWDGTGYGEDHNIWGGEFFEYYENSLSRVAHIDYVPVRLGDKIAKDTRLSALFFCRNLEQSKHHLSKLFSKTEWDFYSRLIETKSMLYTSSMGRLFDAVACLTGVCHFNSYEGEAAMYLEAKAMEASDVAGYAVHWKGTMLDTDDLLEQVFEDIEDNVAAATIASRFHVYLANVIYSMVATYGYKQVAFSGGVFQNALLADLVKTKLKDYNTYFHKEMSPNDECISLGQLAAITTSRKRTSALNTTNATVHSF